MDELIIKEAQGLTAPQIITALEAINQRQSEQLQMMALTIKNMADTVARLEKEVRKLEKLTPMQVTELNACIRKHGKDLCETYGIEGKEAKVNTFIRQELKQEFGISSVKDLARNDFQLAKNVVAMYDDTERLMNLGR